MFFGQDKPPAEPQIESQNESFQNLRSEYYCSPARLVKLTFDGLFHPAASRRSDFKG
jgi:hypothetical protein